MKVFISSLVLLLFLNLSGCKGSSKGDAPTDPNKVFSLDKLNNIGRGEGYTVELTGTKYYDNEPYPVIATYKYYNGQREGIVINDEYIMTNPLNINKQYIIRNIFYNNTYTDYYDDYGYLLRTNMNDCNAPSTSLNKYPTEVKVGDSGSLGVYQCRNSLKIEYKWAARDGLNGNLLFDYIDIDSDHDSIGAPNTTTFKINGSGDILGVYINNLYRRNGVIIKDMILSSD